MTVINSTELIDILITDDVIKVMKELGSDVPKEFPEGLIFEDVCHGDINDRKYKLYYYEDNKRFHCYRLCGNMSIYDVVMKSKKCSFKDAFQFVKSIVNDLNRPIIGFTNTLNRVTNLDDIIVEPLPKVDKPYLYEMFSNEPISEWLNENISIAAMEKFKIRYDKKENKAIIPHFNINDECIGIRQRRFNEIELLKGRPKYSPLFFDNKIYAHPLGQNLYGINISKDNIKKYKKCIIVESEKACMIYETYFPNNNICVAICGSNFSNTQKKMLLDLCPDIEEIVISLDRQYQHETDEEAMQWREKIYKMTENLLPYSKVSYIWDSDKDRLLGYKDSPLDINKSAFLKLIENRIKINKE